jgi:hypothetical protein
MPSGTLHARASAKDCVDLSPKGECSNGPPAAASPRGIQRQPRVTYFGDPDANFCPLTGYFGGSGHSKPQIESSGRGCRAAGAWMARSARPRPARDCDSMAPGFRLYWRWRMRWALVHSPAARARFSGVHLGVGGVCVWSGGPGAEPRGLLWAIPGCPSDFFSCRPHPRWPAATRMRRSPGSVRSAPCPLLSGAASKALRRCRASGRIRLLRRSMSGRHGACARRAHSSERSASSSA